MINFVEPIDNTVQIINESFKLLEKIYRSNYNYKKIGVVLLGLKQNKNNVIENTYIIQSNLFTLNQNLSNNSKKSDVCMKLFDDINSRMGKKTLFYGSQGMQKRSKKIKQKADKWSMRSCYKSPSYTTKWNDVLKVY
jgi:DNA polymerase V